MSIAYKEKEKRRAYQAEYYQAHKGERKTTTSSAVKKRYNDKTYTRYTLNLRKDEDADIIEKLQSVPNKAGYIKELIRRDISTAKSPE